MRTITVSLIIVFILMSVLPMARAADEAASPSTKPLVGNSALPEEIEEAQRLAGLAASLRQQGKLAEAETMYENAMARNAADTDVLGGLVATYMDLGQYEKAAFICNKWVKTEPQSKEANAAFKRAARLTGQISWADSAAAPTNLLLVADKLSLHILVRYTDFTPADVNTIVHEDSLTPRKGELIWLNPGTATIQEAIRNDRGEVLAFNTAARAVLSDGSWSLAGASPDEDATGRPCLNVWFDSRGAKRLSELTRTNIGRNLAIVIDGRIVSAPAIASPVTSLATISGNFTDEDVMRILRTLLPKTPLAIEAKAVEIDSATSLLDFLGNSLGMDFFRDWRGKDFPPPTEPFAGHVNLSEPQAKELLEWLSSQPSARTIAAPRITVFNGEKAALTIGPESRTEVKLSLLPYMVGRNRIWVNIVYSITKPSRGSGEPNGPAMMDSARTDTIVTLGQDDQALFFSWDNAFILIKAAVAELPATTPAPAH